jgi:hypothetical protein
MTCKDIYLYIRGLTIPNLASKGAVFAMQNSTSLVVQLAQHSESYYRDSWVWLVETVIDGTFLHQVLLKNISL